MRRGDACPKTSLMVGLDNLMTGDLSNLEQAGRDPRFHFELGHFSESSRARVVGLVLRVCFELFSFDVLDIFPRISHPFRR